MVDWKLWEISGRWKAEGITLKHEAQTRQDENQGVDWKATLNQQGSEPGAPGILRGGGTMWIPPPAPFSLPAQKAKSHRSACLPLPIALRHKAVVAPNLEIWNGIKGRAVIRLGGKAGSVREAKEEEHFKKMQMANSTKCCWKDKQVGGMTGFGHSVINFHPQITS